MDIFKGTISDAQKAATSTVAQGEQAGKDLITAVDQMIRKLMADHRIIISIQAIKTTK